MRLYRLWPEYHAGRVYTVCRRENTQQTLTIEAKIVGRGTPNRPFPCRLKPAAPWPGFLWIGYLTYGIGVGVGAACAYVPTLALIGGWVVKRRHTASSLAALPPSCCWAVWVMGVSYVVWLTCPAYGEILVFAALLGLDYGARIALMPGVLLAFFGLQKHGAILGLFFTGGGIAAVVGPLLAGGVVDYTGSYRWSITFALAMGLQGCAAIMPVHERVACDHDATAGAG